MNAYDKAEQAINDHVDRLQLRLGALVSALAEHENSRLMIPAWSAKVTAYETEGGRQRPGCQDFRMIRSPERLEKSIEDAEWWLDAMEKGRVVNA